MKHTILFSILALFLVSPAFANSDPITDLPTALAKAKAENKLLFVVFERMGGPASRWLDKYIMTSALYLPESQFVYADLNCDDRAVAKPFFAKFKVEGRFLPFVVVADSDGNQIASRTGRGTLAEYQNMLLEAKKSAGATSSATPGATSHVSSPSGTSFDEAFKKSPAPVNP